MNNIVIAHVIILITSHPDDNHGLSAVGYDTLRHTRLIGQHFFIFSFLQPSFYFFYQSQNSERWRQSSSHR